jgi:hypothetical protein
VSQKDSPPPKPKTFADVVKASKTTSPAVQPPPPAVIPVPTPKPPPVIATAVVGKCPSPSPRERGYPMGFKSQEQFKQCMQELEAALQKEGIKPSAVGVRGSAVTFNSLNPKKKGSYFDKKGVGKSDVDVFFVTKDHLNCAPSNGFFHAGKLAEKYPAIGEWNKKWTKDLGREVSAAGFKPGTKDKPTKMKPTATDSIVHSGGL